MVARHRRALRRRPLRVAALLAVGGLAALAGCGAPSDRGAARDPCRVAWARAEVDTLIEELARARTALRGDRESWLGEYSWMVMTLSADLRGTGRPAAAAALADLLRASAERDAFARVPTVGAGRDNTGSVHRLRLALLPLLTAWEELRRAARARAAEAEAVETWLARLVELADVDTGPEASRHGPRDCGRAPDWFDSNCNHRRYLRQAVNLAWGLAREDAPRVQRAVAGYRDALARMRSDGGMPGELGRGSRAIWYTREAIAALVYMAEIAARRDDGLDLYGAEVEGRSLHLAIRFFLDAVDDPRRVWPDAKTNFAPGTRKYYRRQVLRFLEPRPSGRHLMAWVEPYAARFPEHENARRLTRLGDGRLLDGDRPLVDELMGANATCFYGADVR